MALELTAKLIKVLPEVTGQGKNGTWQKKEFIVETSEQYPKKVCLTAWGDKINDLARFSLGDTITCHLSPESREYNERWYTEIRAYRIDAAGNAGGGQYNNTARPAAASAATPLPEPLTSFDEGTEDLPF
jgi:hypothetical protein